MLFAGEESETKTYDDRAEELPAPVTVETVTTEGPLPSENELFDLYEKIVESRPGSRDAQIFSKIREWTFSDFSVSPHEFAGISKNELAAWQKRHRINLSSGHIRPEPIDIARGHAWGQVRREDHVNGRHTQYGPPSREELLEMMGAAN